MNQNNAGGAVLIGMPMGSENTLYHVMSLRGAERRSNLQATTGKLLRLRLTMTRRDATGAILPCLGTAFETVSKQTRFHS
jgi:hypothetical protein